MKPIRIFFFIFVLLFSLTTFQALGEVKTVELMAAEDQPPGQMTNEADGLHGYCVEIFQAVCAKAGFQAKVTYQPWARAQETVKSGNNLVIMGIGKTPEREKAFQWVCPAYNMDWVFVSANGKVYDMNSAKTLGSVMVAAATPIVPVLTKAGYTNLAPAPVNLMNAKKLAAGRGDAWVTPLLSAKWIWKREGLPGKITIGPSIMRSEQWMAISPGSDQALIAALKKGFDAIKADGTYQKIMNRYDD